MYVPLLMLTAWAFLILITGYLVGRWKARTDYATILKTMIEVTRKEDKNETDTFRKKD